MSPPRATMRLQFHRGFTFADAAALVPYFASLGISHLYASPIMTARPGSLHGYDTVDPTRVNPELGGEDGLRRLVRELRRYELGLIVDIVPNHMAVGNANAWWMDVLAHGRQSRYAKYFDIDWTPSDPLLHDKVLLPVLGRPYGEALAAGEITLAVGASQRPVVRYFDHDFPLAAGLADAFSSASPTEFSSSSPTGQERLHDLLEEQHYRLAWWRCANDEINWRRFFDINELAAIRIEDEEVFEAVHGTIFRLYAEGLVDGVRVDHVDGLARPGEYCRRLRACLQAIEKDRPCGCPTGPAYFVVEKILAHDEQLPARWEADGTTGYDFMDEVSALQHDPAGEQPLTDLWNRLSGRPDDFKAEEERARREILQRSFSSQLEATLDVIFEIAQGDLATRDIARSALRRCLTEVLVQFQVYRTYAQVGESSESDRAVLSRAVAVALKSCLPSDRWLVAWLGPFLGGEPVRPGIDSLQARALTRVQQLSAPLSAKAVEDTAFYRYGRLLSRNDVGFDPARFACSATDFHERMQLRRRSFPHALLATATHDHKRGEDVRARLAVLSEIPDEWSHRLERWMALSARQHRAADGAPRLERADQIMLFQTLVGAWPMALSTADHVGTNRFAERVAAWQLKALREAKWRSDWSAPDEAYESAAETFLASLFGTPELLAEVADFARRISAAGAVNSLGQVLVKLTAPGVPDFYQGTEFWDLSLVDPDNRAPVDFAARQQSLAAVTISESIDNWADGRIKLLLIARVLAVRKHLPELFARGDYMSLDVDGPLRGHVFAFARLLADSSAIAVVCRHPASLLGEHRGVCIAKRVWHDTRIFLAPKMRASHYFNAVTGDEIDGSNGFLRMQEVFSTLSAALLTTRNP